MAAESGTRAVVLQDLLPRAALSQALVAKDPLAHGDRLEELGARWRRLIWGGLECFRTSGRVWSVLGAPA